MRISFVVTKKSLKWRGDEMVLGRKEVNRDSPTRQNSETAGSPLWGASIKLYRSLAVRPGHSLMRGGRMKGALSPFRKWQYD
jgi:hypothetical protein